MNFLAGTLNENLGNIVTKLNELMDSFWLYIVLALAGVVVVWGAYVGIRIAVAHRNEEKINARGMVKSLIIGIIIMFVVAVGAPLLINGLNAWVGTGATDGASIASVMSLNASPVTATNGGMLASSLNENLQEIITKLQELMDSFWVYIVMALAGVVVIWGAYVGIRIAVAHRNEEKINARDMVKSLVIGIVIIFVVAMGAPLLINGLSAWVG